jgi:hypothetical protein
MGSVMQQMDLLQQASLMNPRAQGDEHFHRQARDSAARTCGADWEARKNMRNMEIFRSGGIPPDF